MRFFNTPDTSKLLKQIAGELVNITYGETYFDSEGNILEAKVPGHNTYNIDSVEYSIVPNYGIVHIPNNTNLYNTLVNAIEAKFHEMFRIAATKFGMPKIPIYCSGTTQYLGIANPGTTGTSGVVKFAPWDNTPTIPTGTHFLWHIASQPFPVSYYTKNNPSSLYSLSSIVVDTSNTIQLPNGFKGPDYPAYADYKIYKEGKLQLEPIDYHANYGIHLELTKHYPNVARNKKKSMFTKCSRGLRLVKWEWLNFYSINSDSVMEWYKQIQMGLLETEPNEEVNHSCFTTNAPIYDDCYVFDIVERTIEETIEENDFDKYPGAVVVEDVPVAITATVEKKKKKKIRFVGLDSNGDEDSSVDSEEEVEVIPVSKKTAKSKASQKTKTAPKIIKTASKVIKRGAKEPTKMIKIKYTKKYDTPKCVLISPYYVHLYGYLDAVAEFEKLTKTKVFVYRTKSPISVYDAIENSNASKLTKQILTLLYDSATLKDYNSITVSETNVKLSIGDGSSRNMSNVLFVDDSVITAQIVNSIDS